MLSSENARILLFIKENDNVVFSNELPAFVTQLRLEALLNLGYIHCAVHSSGIAVYQLLPAGEDELSAFTQYEEKRAADEADKRREENLQNERWRKDARRSWVQWTVTTILAVASFFAGAIVEKFTGFMKWIISLFH